MTSFFLPKEINQLPCRKRTGYERPNALDLEGIAASGGEYHPKILRLRSGSLPALPFRQAGVRLINFASQNQSLTDLTSNSV